MIDERVGRLWGEQIRGYFPDATYLTVESGESSKQLEVAGRLWNQLYEGGAARDSTLIAIGGGAVCDLGGFVAGCYMRGIRCALVPTTLLAMVDAAIGGKCAVNHHSSKNIVGLFHQPTYTVVDTQFLSTLPDRQHRCGMAEILKAGLIDDPELFNEAMEIEQMIERAINVKRRIVVMDEKETLGQRALLNLGHTFAHAIESESGFTTIHHGEAVAIGLHLAAQMSAALGLASADLPEIVKNRLVKEQLPTDLPPDLDPRRILDKMAKDKKQPSDSEGQILVLLEDIGKARVVECVDRSLIAHLLGVQKNPILLYSSGKRLGEFS